MGRSVVILAGGYSKRFGRPKAFIELTGKPLISHVYDKARKLSDEVLIVISPKDQVESFSRLFNGKVSVVIDNGAVHSPLVGTLAGFDRASGEYSLLLPCDTPFLSDKVLSLLFDICNGFDLTVPRWPNGYIEPLQAIYHTRSAARAAKTALSKGGRDMRSMISLLRRVRYLSTIILEELDPRLNTFFNVNTRSDLRKAERMFSKA
ncbi:MAG: molybdenum cofactor guanylyltransferase [Candidatus Bathyarchaeota archaeon]|nr:molybdenum cofactor guanylyltransferase [Candidatus Bathyarchaeota archaeon]MDH5689623.1 molybdenum cofactor guanylyltransferase [Candidatus Bathyarchaeota archaeon]